MGSCDCLGTLVVFPSTFLPWGRGLESGSLSRHGMACHSFAMSNSKAPKRLVFSLCCCSVSGMASPHEEGTAGGLPGTGHHLGAQCRGMVETP